MPDEPAPEVAGERALPAGLERLRRVSLRRSFRGYDPTETDQLLAEVAEQYAKLLLGERTTLRAELDELREIRIDQEAAQVKSLTEQLAERDTRLAALEQNLQVLEADRTRVADDAEQLRAALAELRRWKGAHEGEATELRHQARRAETRERALTARIAMLEAQLQEARARADAATASARPDSGADRRAWSTLITADRIVEKLTRDARREAELTLKKARRRAEVLVRSAKDERDRVRADLEQLTATERGRIRADLERLTALEAELNEGIRVRRDETQESTEQEVVSEHGAPQPSLER
jgi:cell division septum initiation protein DivIVA